MTIQEDSTLRVHCAVISAACGRAAGERRARTRRVRRPPLCRPVDSSRRLKDDSSDDIVSWVDGQVVTDWSAEIAKRERAIDGYLNDTDPGRAAKYGFRSGQNPQLGWSWFRDNPVGFNGVPFVLFKTILDLDPNHPEPDAARGSPASGSARRRARSAPGSPPLAGRSITSASAQLRPTTSTASRDRSANDSRRCRSASRSRTRARSSRCRTADTKLRDGRLLARARVPEHQPAARQARDRRSRRQLGDGSPRLRQPRLDGSRVLLVRGVPRRPRGGGREDEVPARHAQHRDRSAVLLEAADAHRARRSSNPASIPSSPTPVNPADDQAEYERGAGAVHGDARQGAAAARDAVRIVAGADRARQDPDARGRRRIPERDAGSDRRRRQDALHLLRRREEQRLQAPAAGRPRRSPRPDGRVRHRVRPGRDPHAAPGQQLHAVRANATTRRARSSPASRRRTVCRWIRPA